MGRKGGSREENVINKLRNKIYLKEKLLDKPESFEKKINFIRFQPKS